MFFLENLGDCIKENASTAVYYFVPMLLHLVVCYLHSYNQCYVAHRAIIYLLLNFSIANSTLSLMLVNMTKREFRPLQLTYLWVILPLLVPSHVQIVTTSVCAVLAFCEFGFDMFVLSRQFMAHNKLSLIHI